MNLPFPWKHPDQSEIFTDYDPETEPALVEAAIPEAFDLVESYWVDKGRSLVCILLNRHIGQNEYHLMEPALSPFEYELLERLHEDLRDTLIVWDDEMICERKRVQTERLNGLIRGLQIRVR